MMTDRMGKYIKKHGKPDSPARSLLLACLRADCDPDFSGLGEAAGREVDWIEFTRLCTDHNVYPTVYEVLRKADGLAPAEILAVLGDWTRRNTLRCMTLTAELIRLTGGLQQNGLRTLALKGPALAQQAYGNAGRRVSCDLDLLVEPDRWRRAMEILRADGYEMLDMSLTPKQLGILQEQSLRWHFCRHDPEIEVDLHWSVAQEYCDRIVFDALWDEADVVKIDGNPVRVLAKGTGLIYLAIHGAKHHWANLRNLLDIVKVKTILSDADWARVEVDTERLKLGPVIGQTMLLGGYYLHDSWPEEFQEYAGQRKARSLVKGAVSIAGLLAGSNDGLRVRWKLVLSMLRYQWLLASDWPGRIAALFDYFRLRDYDYHSLRLPDRLHFLYYPLRPFMGLLRKAGLLREKTEPSSRQRERGAKGF